MSESDERKPTLRELPGEKQFEAMRWLWRRMAAIYGTTRWEKTYPFDDSWETWADRLGPYTGRDLKHGTDIAERDSNQWPPTLPEFARWCRQYQPGTFSGAGALPGVSEFVKKAEKLADSATARAEIQKMKAILSARSGPGAA